MTAITQTEVSAAAGYTAAAGYDKTVQNTKTSKENQTAAVKKSKVTNARTIGEPELSEKAQKYYDQLRWKHGIYSCQQRHEAAGAGKRGTICESKPDGCFNR